MRMTRRGFLLASAASALAGCRVLDGKVRKYALNPSTIREFKLPLDEQVRLAIAAGYDGFEPWLKDVYAAEKAGKLDDIRLMAADAGLEFINGIAFGTWSSPDAQVRARGLEETRRDMAILQRLGCPCVAASVFGIQRPGSPLVPLTDLAERYACVLDIGRDEGVRPLLEYWGHSVNLCTPEAAFKVVEYVGRRDAAVLADVYHTYRGGGSFEMFRRMTANRVPVLHVNDYPARTRQQLTDADRVWPGDGDAPWEQILGNLAAAGNSPWLSLELFNLSYQRTTPSDTVNTGIAMMSARFPA